MKLYLHGHGYKYVAEQMLLTPFPAQRPEYPAGPPAPGEDVLVLSLHRGVVQVTATAALSYGGREYRAARRCRTAGLTDPPLTDRALQWTLKLTFYGVGIAARGGELPWGVLTGVRPVKIPTKAMLAGAGPAQAERLLRDIYRVTEGRWRLATDCAGASLVALRSLAPGEVSLYAGVPFCSIRCAHCSFVSADVGRTLKLTDPFLDVLCRELTATGAMLVDVGLRVRTAYFGGGTPTTLSVPQLDRLMGELVDHIDPSGCTECTVETGRPDIITTEELAVLAHRGYSWMSVNPQTMQDTMLEWMGRAHRVDDIFRAYALARESSIGCINTDLIAGLFGGSAEGFRVSLEQVLDLGSGNVTVHTLALKKSSRLMEEGGDLLSGAAVADTLDLVWAALRGAGQRPYYLYRQRYMPGSFENVGWCRPDTESLYNICMMEKPHTIVSLGGGGVTKLVDRVTGYIERPANAKYPQECIQKTDTICVDKGRVVQFYAAHGRQRREDVPHQLSEINEKIRWDPTVSLTECDAHYQERIHAVMDKTLVRMKENPTVLLSGPSGSGKTTTAMKVEWELGYRGVNAHTVSMDNYFKTLNRRTAPRTPEEDTGYELPKLLDMELLDEIFDRLFRGEGVIIPYFEFARQMRNDGRGIPLRLGKDEIAIFESIHALNDDIASRHPEATGIYISARSNILEGEQLCSKGAWMHISRRTVRDYNFRGTDLLETLLMWYNARRGEKTYILSYKGRTHVTIDPSLRYEVPVFAHHADALRAAVEQVPPDNERWQEYHDLVDAFRYFEPVDPALVAPDFLLRGFIGGGSYHY